MGPEELDDDDDVAPTSPFLPPADRLWRHPSELAAARSLHPAPLVPALAASAPRPAWQVALVAGLASALVVVAAVAFTGGFTTNGTEGPGAQEAGTMSTLVSTAPSSTDVMALAAKVRPSLCHVETTSGAWGSALLLDDRHLVASARVVGDATEVAVTLPDGTVETAEVVGRDPSTDVAVVRLSQGTDVEAAALGSAASLEAGEPAIAVAAPMSSDGYPVVSVGAVSRLGRQVHVEGSGLLRDLIETTAPLVTTSSGGVLLDRHGAVVGLTTAVPPGTAGAEGQGFAAPIDVVRDVAADLIETGVVERSWLGIEGSDLDGAARAQLGVDDGALVHAVDAGGPAALAGVAAQDVVVALDGQAVHSMGQLVILMAAYDPGDEVELAVRRGGQRVELPLTFGTR